MTELQVAINNIKEAIIAGELLLGKLEKARRNLENPPRHKWKHGDVFRNESNNSEMIHIKLRDGSSQVFCLGGCTGHDDPKMWLSKGKFLFNIKEKL